MSSGSSNATRRALRVAVLTVSDATVAGLREDRSGADVATWVTGRGDLVVARAVVRDETVAIARQLLAWCDADGVDLVLTTGGTGLSPRDVTPEATRAVVEREAVGIAESIRGAAVARVPRAALSRGVAGVRGRTLIVNLPGSPAGVRDGLDVLDPIADHACDILADRATDHSPGAPGHQRRD